MRTKLIDIVEITLAVLIAVAAVVMLFFDETVGTILMAGSTTVVLIAVAVSKEFRRRF